MKTKTSLLISTTVALLMATSAYAGDEKGGSGEGGGIQGTKTGDTQTITTTIPEVSMIDVPSKLVAKLEPPTEAGDNFKKTSVGEKKLSYAISTNISATEAKQTRTIIATSENIPAGWKIHIKMDAPTGGSSSAGELELTSSTTTANLVTGIQNVAQHGVGMTVAIGPEDEHIMPSHTDEGTFDASIVYTITAGK